MAKRTSTIVIDDLTGAELGDEAVTVTFALEGAAYEIDLAPSAAAELREALAPFTAAARKVGGSRRGSAATSAPAGEQSAARAWLIEQGVDVPARGRLSAELLERYRAR
ncbi:histone-like nucleoid-structuring protein Lsr2 [Arenivirga flava]|uniref:Lsr2 family protein n=1 Tax=Arenivirga flava TaxID=1930060 RepID=A0AA37UKD5_9MICO|nr:Lsr2 family protein [Arenivirga flava]GMA28901.1 Lsr2 family protein [Arenivirga flava]